MEFRVGDLLIEETPPPPWRAPPGWGPRVGICVEPIPDRDRARNISILIEGQVIWGIPVRWKVACRAE
jgi:hypothetical protein